MEYCLKSLPTEKDTSQLIKDLIKLYSKEGISCQNELNWYTESDTFTFVCCLQWTDNHLRYFYLVLIFWGFSCFCVCFWLCWRLAVRLPAETLSVHRVHGYLIQKGRTLLLIQSNENCLPRAYIESVLASGFTSWLSGMQNMQSISGPTCQFLLSPDRF